MVQQIKTKMAGLRRHFSRAEWLIRILSLGRAQKDREERRGLILLQVDGLAYRQFLRALENGRLPFLQRLINSEDYHIHSFYSGLPSSTPGVQGELLYGRVCAVPSFGFRDVDTGKMTSMFDSKTAKKIEYELEKDGEALLKGGSAYAFVYTGGAERSAFCLSRIGPGSLSLFTRPLGVTLTALLYASRFLHVAALIVVELFLSIVDFFRGIVGRNNLKRELKFISARVGICILLRELVTLSVMVDAVRGQKIIAANFLGYDEQSHRRGPESRFAHWSLKGIDNSIKRIWRAAHRSTHRDYDIWIYSDHGQEKVNPYRKLKGENFEDTVHRIADEVGVGKAYSIGTGKSVQRQRAALLGLSDRMKKFFGLTEDRDDIEFTGVGPVYHIFFEERLQRRQKEQMAKALVEKAGVPIVMFPDKGMRVVAHTQRGRFRLPTDAAQVVGFDHPFLPEIGYDLARLVHHPGAGELVVSGWDAWGTPMSFPVENGAHAGPGYNETHGFALLLGDTPLAPNTSGYIRPRELREAVLRFQGRSSHVALSRSRNTRSSRVLRVMTYNIHSCIGMDGECSPERISRIILRHDPDIVALQEIDSGKERSGLHDQAKVIAHQLDMMYHFHPSFIVREGEYGNAVLSRLPMHVVKAGLLPGFQGREPRAALWVEVDWGNTPVQLIATHLSLFAGERAIQARALVGPEWMGNKQCARRAFLCGDFNSLPNTAPYRIVTRHLQDTAVKAPHGDGNGRTFMGVARLDYVFVSRDVRIRKVLVPRTRRSRLASDHSPLVVDLELR